jgi:Cof subfamily protein (haloacid dehalogenase superfamily)
MDYKLIAADMDGTLLDPAGQITPATAAAIRRAMDAGVRFCVSTGRPLQGIAKYGRDLPFNAPAIAYNGAVVADVATGQVLFSRQLERADAQKILLLGDGLQTTMCIWSRDRLYCNVCNDRTARYQTISGVEPIQTTDYASVLEQGITKILWYDAPEAWEAYRPHLQAAGFGQVTYCTSQPMFLEFFHSAVSKAAAMEFLGRHYGICREEMIAIGDGMNDLAMIEYAGLGVAMDNAPPEVKTAAQYVTASNRDDGVAQVIHTFILK